MIKLPELRINSGCYRGTNSMGHEVYGPDYYDVDEVEKFIRLAKKLERKYKKQKKTSCKFRID